MKLSGEDASNLPRTIAGQGSLGPTSSEFFYGPDQRRWKQVTSYAGVTEETIYIAGILEKVTQGSVTAWKHYIAGGSGPVALYIRKSDGGESTHYFARDHLGSVDSISDAAGAVQVRLSYSAFGRRRNGAGWSGEPPGADFNIVAGISRRGFTDHEMLDNLSLVHMNGRVYDPRLGRFISADPFIDCAMNTQGWNRYSYVKSNPLSFTDPSGYLQRHYLPTDLLLEIQTVYITGQRIDPPGTHSYDGLQRVGPQTGDLGSNEGGGGGGSEDDGPSEEVLVSGPRDDKEEPVLPVVIPISVQPEGNPHNERSESNQRSVSECWGACMDDRLNGAADFLADTLAINSLGLLLNAPVTIGGQVTLRLGTYTGLIIGRAIVGSAGGVAGAVVGSGISTGVALAGAALGGYALGTAGDCAARCAASGGAEY